MFEKLQFWKKREDPLPTFDTGLSSDSAGMLDPFAQPTQSQPLVDPFASQSSQNSFSQGMQTPYSQTQNWNQFNAGANVQQPFGHQSQPSQAQSAPSSSSLQNRDIDLILSRLDLIKAEVENVSHRMTLLEQELRQKPKW
jgi:hypothetical protein